MLNVKRGEPMKKKIRNYEISYCRRDFIGRSLFGQIRLGINMYGKTVLAFRINPLPISQYIQQNTKIQDQISVVKDAVCTIRESFQTQSNRYTVMQYFPKTFKTQLGAFQKSTKYLNEMLENFFQAYSILYHLRFNHGNISLENIGITYDNKVKLMDFRPLNLSFEEGAMKDFRDFRIMMCTIMLRDQIFPDKLQALDAANGNWDKLFSAWHIVSPYHYLFTTKKNPIQNSIILLNKLQQIIVKRMKDSTPVRIALRLLVLQFYLRLDEAQKGKNFQTDIKKLKQILSPIFEHDISFYNSILWGIMTDPDYYGLTQQHRLAVICCLIQGINHECLYIDILQQFKNPRPNYLTVDILSNNLIKHYSFIIRKNLLQQFHRQKHKSHRSTSTVDQQA